MMNEEDQKKAKKGSKMTYFRWFIVVMMFVAILFNYADREIWVSLEPAFTHSFGLYSGTGKLPPSAIEFSTMVLFIWSLAYAIFNFPGGWIVDRLGLRKSMATMYAIWSTFTVLTAFTFNFISMAIVRAIMGAGEGAVWPVNAKMTKNWASRLSESKAFTMSGSGQAVGPVVALLSVTALVSLIGIYNWRWIFVIFGVLGLILSLVWYVFIRDTPSQDSRLSAAELEYLNKGKSYGEKEETNPLSSKANWKISLHVIFGTQAGIGTLLVFLSFGYILFTFLYWLPPLMFSTFSHTVTKSSLYSAMVDIGLILGFIGSGFWNDGLLRHFPKVTARRIGAIVPMVLMILFVGLSYFTGTAKMLLPTIILLATGSALMNLTVGSWAVNAVDIAPSGTSAVVYGVYNGSLNLMGAFNSIIEGFLFIKYGPVIGFTSAIIFMVMFLAGYMALIRKSTWDKARMYGEKLIRENEEANNKQPEEIPG
ncbi:MAG: MFS transporter [Thermoplasmata archaeon]